MSQLFFLLILLGCPLMMVFMMRGMHGGHSAAEHENSSAPKVVDMTGQDARIVELEREVARLRDDQRVDDAPDSAFVDRLQHRLDKTLVEPRK